MRRLYFGTLVLALRCYCGDKVNYGFHSKQLFQRVQQPTW